MMPHAADKHGCLTGATDLALEVSACAPQRTDPQSRVSGVQLRGFTLLETMLAMTIVLVGVLAVMQAQRAFLFNNLWSSNAATASYLAGEIRELTRALPRHDRFAGGLWFETPGDPSTLRGWGLEGNETMIAHLDDLDDFDGLVFGDATTLPDGFTLAQRFSGPINAFGEVIAERDWSGEIVEQEVGEESVPVSMAGWTQVVEVELVDPRDFSASANLAVYDESVRDINDYPVRVTVTVLYQGEWSTEAPAITRVSWIVPP
jgi:prepilin-type N-terminal cleavage/methylation domain-containing protein